MSDRMHEGSAVGARPLSRRGFLGLGLSALAVTGCTPVGSSGPAQAAPTVRAAPTEAPGPSVDARSLFSSTLFYVAHRGSYDNWPEHTLEAYTQAAAAGAKAIEISVNATADGVLVCHHDRTTKRWSDETLTIADVTFEDLQRVPVDAREWLGPASKPQPIPRLTDVLDAFMDSHVLLVEDKQGTNTQALLDLIDTYPSAREHVVWKQWAGAGQYRLAKERGYQRWGYFTTDILERLDELHERFDYLGVQADATDEQIKAVVSVGKPVIAWEVHSRSTRDRLNELGVTGIMCSNVPYVTGTTAAAADTFGTGLRAAGDLPWTTSKGASLQPSFDVLSSALTIDHDGIQSYSMGSMCPVVSDTYTLSFDMRWPDQLPEAGQHAGVAFGLKDDQPYRVRVASAVAGYHMVLRSSGSMELYARAAGEVDGTRLGGAPTVKPEPGQWMTFTIMVSPERIRVARDGLDSWQFELDDAQYRGGYFSLCKNYSTATAVQFRSIAVR